MWDLLDFVTGIDRLREDSTVVQLLCMLGILVTLVVCGYMAFRHGQYVWLSGGAVVIAFLTGVIFLCRKLDE